MAETTHRQSVASEVTDRASPQSTATFRVCFVGSVVFTQPLDETNAKKFQALKALGELFVIGFAPTLRGARFTQDAHFRLLPAPSAPLLRFLVLYSLGVLAALGFILRDGATLLVAQGPHEGFAAALAKVGARALGRKVGLLVESHGDFERDVFLQRRTNLAGFYRLCIRIVSKFTLRHADALRAVSTSTREQLARWEPSTPIVTFPAWTDIDAFFEAGRQAKEDANVFLYAGVLIPRKGVDGLIDAFSRIAAEAPDSRLEIVGREDDPDYATALSSKVESLGLGSRVTFHPPMPQSELAEKMARASALVLPSVSEGLGRVVFEAMASGTLVIGSRVGGIVDMIADGETGFLIAPGQIDELTDRLRWVVQHPIRAREMGEQARKFATEFFSTERYVLAYREAFSLTSQSSGAFVTSN